MVKLRETIQFKIRKIQDGLPDHAIIAISDWIYPENRKKYYGSFCKRGKRFECQMRKYKFYKTVDTREEAEKLIKEKNLDFKCEVKNCYRMCVDNKNIIYEVKLTRNQTCFVDQKDLEIIEKHIWCADKDTNGKTWYVETSIDNKIYKLHNMILDHTPNKITVDHLNHDGLDNRRRNLKLKSIRGQAINHSLQINNTSGIKGVYFHKRDQAWFSRWTDENGKQKSSSYYYLRDYSEEEAKQLAKQERDEAISNLAHYNE